MSSTIETATSTHESIQERSPRRPFMVTVSTGLTLCRHESSQDASPELQISSINIDNHFLD